MSKLVKIAQSGTLNPAILKANMDSKMAQARMLEAQLDNTTYYARREGIYVEANGLSLILKLEVEGVDPELLKEIQIALNDALRETVENRRRKTEEVFGKVQC